MEKESHEEMRDIQPNMHYIKIIKLISNKWMEHLYSNWSFYVERKHFFLTHYLRKQRPNFKTTFTINKER